jgi:hypothetical protein
MTQLNREWIDTSNIANKYGDVIHFGLMGTDAATAANYGVLPFIAPYAIEVIAVSVAYSTASTSGTLQIELLDDGEAAGTGDSLLEDTISLSSTANTAITRNGRELTSTRQLDIGGRFGLVDGGTLTNLDNLIINIYYKPLGRGNYR